MTNTSILKAHFISLLTALSLSFVACSNNTQTATVGDGNNGNGGNNGGNGGQDKPTYDVAPLFSEAQLSRGQWIEWKKTGKDGSVECVRWMVTDFVSSGVKIEGRFSRNCTTPDDYMVEHILFRPDTGHVLEDVIVTPNSQKNGPLYQESIFDHIYGYKHKVEFKTGKQMKTDDQKKYYPVYQLKGKSQVFLNRPSTPFHAFAIRWTEISGGNSWVYELHASNPVIETQTVSP